jgi:hypothetical protein
MCISYVIPKIETRGEKKLSRKGNFARGRQPVARSPPSDRSLISMAPFALHQSGQSCEVDPKEICTSPLQSSCRANRKAYMECPSCIQMRDT